MIEVRCHWLLKRISNVVARDAKLIQKRNTEKYIYDITTKEEVQEKYLTFIDIEKALPPESTGNSLN